MANGDEAGALAAADYLLELYTYTYWSGDDEPLWEFCDPASKFCQSVFGRVAQITTSSQKYVGGKLSWTETPNVTPIEGLELPAYEVRGTLHEEENSFVNADGTTAESHPATVVDSVVVLYLDEDKWVLFAFSQQTEK